MIEFGPWVPDQKYQSGALTEAVNVIPVGKSYRSLPTESVVTTAAVSGSVLAGFSTRLVNGLSKTYVGTSSAIYERNGAAWDNVSTGTYTIAAGNRWEFTQYASDVYAVSLDEGLVKQTAGTGSFAAVSGGPSAACIANIRRWVVVGDLDESSTLIPHKVKWSAIDDPDDWTISEATQCGSQELDAKDGRVMAIKGGEFGIILQQHAVTRMSYVGAPIVWQFDKIDDRNGCEVSGSAVQVGRVVYYLSHDGFRATDGSGESLNIGDNIVNNWFRANLSTANKASMRGAYNQEWRCVVWTFPSASGDGTNDSFLMFHIPSGRWARGDYGAQVLFDGATSTVTLEGLDSYFASIEDVTPSLDDPFWMGGESKFLGVSEGKLTAYEGTPGTARLETFETEPNVARKTRVLSIEPVIDGTTTVQIGYRNLPSDTVAYTGVSTVNSGTGIAHIGHVSRWQRYRFNVTGAFTEASGFNINLKAAGVK